MKKKEKNYIHKLRWLPLSPYSDYFGMTKDMLIDCIRGRSIYIMINPFDKTLKVKFKLSGNGIKLFRINEYLRMYKEKEEKVAESIIDKFQNAVYKHIEKNETKKYKRKRKKS
jgi:hypothetical protein